MPARADKGRLRAADVQALIRDAMRPRAIDTSGGAFKLIAAIYRQGLSDGQRALAAKGGHARKKTNLNSKINRWRVYAYFRPGNKQFWAHPQAKQNLLKLQAALAAKNIKVSPATIRKDVAEMKRIAAGSAGRPAQAPRRRHVKVPAQ